MGAGGGVLGAIGKGKGGVSGVGLKATLRLKSIKSKRVVPE
jgi:shikimate kinase